MSTANFMKKQAAAIPRDPCPDSTLNLLMEGYLFIPNRMRKYKSTIFQTRLMGKKAVCISGKKAAEVFYDQSLFTRKGAMPGRIQETLFGKKAIQTLDGASHMHRKLLFMSFMTEPQVARIGELAKKQWQINSRKWEKRGQIALFDESTRLIFQVACQWVGVPVDKSEVRQKAADMSAMIDAFGAAGPRHWKGRCARNRTERWAQSVIQDVRTGRTAVPDDCVLYAIAWHKDLSNRLLSTGVAAVELINILRPITAIATYITFGALALETFPQYRQRLQAKDDVFLTWFVQEVRRFYPFAPFLGARVRDEFTWQKHKFRKGNMVFLDIYGTNHDKAVWGDPNVFRPEHFQEHAENPFDFIPQGGGDYKMGTRCPGEWITIELMKKSIDFLVNDLDYQVPIQDLTFSLRRIPTLPKSRFIMTNIRKK